MASCESARQQVQTSERRECAVWRRESVACVRRLPFASHFPSDRLWSSERS